MPPRLLFAASHAIPSGMLLPHLPSAKFDWDGEIWCLENNRSLVRAISETWPEAKIVSAKGPVSMKQLVAQITHLAMFWDGDDLGRLLFEARMKKIKTKVVTLLVTTVVNRRTSDFDVYIGRGSPWGNPFVMGHGEGPDRAEVIQKYQEFFDEKIKQDDTFRKGVLSLKGYRLGCYCKPAACHGDVIANYLNSSDVDDDGKSQSS